MRIPLLITIVHKNKMRLLFWQAHGLFVKIGTFPQTTYAGITRIRFKGLCFQQISASRRPCFHVRFQYSRSASKVKPPAAYRASRTHILEQAHFGGREQS